MGGAGLLPVALHKSKLYFLFGKENKYEDSAPGFADFGGGHENGETAMETAIREGSEELSGFLGNEEDIKKLFSKNGTYTISYKQYSTFIVPIKYDKKLEYYFNKNLKFVLSHLDSKLVSQTRIFEKEEIRWVCYDDLTDMKKEFRSFFKNIVTRLMKERKKIEKFVKEKTYKKNKRTRKKNMGPANKKKSIRKKGGVDQNNIEKSVGMTTSKSCCRCELPIIEDTYALGGKANGVICFIHRSCQSCWWDSAPIMGKRNAEPESTRHVGLVNHPFQGRKPKCPGCFPRSNGLPYPPYMNVEPVDLGKLNSENVIELDFD